MIASRKNNLDFLRFFLACVVIHTHSYEISGHHYHGVVSRLKHLELGGAWLAVDGFFAISGMLITASWLKSHGVRDYAMRRIRRIYPGFLAAILFCIVIVGPLGGAKLATYFQNPQTYRFLMPLILGPTAHLPDVFQTVPWRGIVNGSLWTIRFEVACYILVAIIGLAGLLRRRHIVGCIFLLSIAAQSAQQAQWPGQWQMVVPFFGDLWESIRFIVFFLAGMTFQLYRKEIPFNWRLFLLFSILLGVGSAFGYATIVLPLSAVYLLFFVAFREHLPLHGFARHGDFSYGMYLYAFPIQQLCVFYLPFARDPLLLTLTAFCLTFGCAWLSWNLVEKRFLRPRIDNQVPSSAEDLEVTRPICVGDRQVLPR